MNDYDNISNLELNSYKGVGSLNEDNLVATSDLSDAVSAICYNLSNMLDKRDENSIVSGNVEISGFLSVDRNIVHGTSLTSGIGVGDSNGNPDEVEMSAVHGAAFNNSKAFGLSSFAANNGNAYAKHSAAFNGGTAYSSYSFAHGTQTSAFGYVSHVEGEYTQTGLPEQIGNSSSRQTYGAFSHAEGDRTKAIGLASHAEGSYTYTLSTASQAHAEGSSTSAVGIASHVEGYKTKAIGECSHAEGNQTYAVEQKSHAEGGEVSALGFASHAEGYKTKAVGDNSHAEGNSTYAGGQKSHTEGGEVSALGFASHAEGRSTIARARYSHTEGANSEVLSTDDYSFVWSGKYNPHSVYYKSHGVGSFSINPQDGTKGFWIGDKSFANYLSGLSGDLNSQIKRKLDKYDGGVISNDVGITSGDLSLSGDLNVVNHSMNILSGNFVQTNSISVENFSYKNAFLQAECVYAIEGKLSGYGIACTGSRGYCILSAFPELSAVKLSGDTSQLSTNISYSWAFGNGGGSMELTIISIDNDRSIVQFGQSLPKEISSTAGISSEAEMISAFTNDDNALYYPLNPALGVGVIHNFYGNHAEGGSVKAIGKYTHAEGRATIADMRYSHAEGDRTFAGKLASHAEGQETSAFGNYAHSEGKNTAANGNQSHAEGFKTVASGAGSHAEGGDGKNKGGTASGDGSHAEGLATQAKGKASHAAGISAVADGDYSYVWNGISSNNYNPNKGDGTFCINPVNGTEGFYVGSQSLCLIISNEISSAQSHADGEVHRLKSQISSALSTIAADPLSSLNYSSNIDNVISAAVEMRNILSSLYDAMRS